MKNIRWGIIGCGNVTEVKSGPAFQKVKGSELIAVMRRDAELAKDYAKRHGVKKWHTSAIELINDPEVDAVYIATPPANHKEYAILSVKAGKPVYVEKPMALNFEECNEMIQASVDTKVPMFVAFYCRKLPRFLKIQELIFKDNVIGKPYHVNIVLYSTHEKRYQDKNNLPWHVLPDISGGGLFVDLAPHTLDILDFLFGPINYATGHAGSQLKAYPAEDTVAMAFTFENGIHGTGLWNFTSFKDYDKVEIVGDKGKISFSTFGDTPIVVENATGSYDINITNPVHIQQPLIESIVNELLGEGKCPSSAVSASRTSWVMDQVLKPYYNKK